MQKGFTGVFILIGILVVGLGVAGAWYTRIIEIPGFPPPGCYYKQVQCIQAPCNPILTCEVSSPDSVITPENSKLSLTPSKTKTETLKFEPGKIIVKFKPGISVNSNVLPSQATNSKSINQLLEKIQANKIKSLYYEENTPMFATASARDPILERYYAISFSKDSDVEQIVSEFQADPVVENASPNAYGHITQ